MNSEKSYMSVLRPRDRTAIKQEIKHALNVARWKPARAAHRCADMAILHQNCMAAEVRQAIKVVEGTAKEFLLETGARIGRISAYKRRLRWKYEDLALPELRYCGDNYEAVEALYKAATTAEREAAEDRLRRHAELGADACLFGVKGIDNKQKPAFFHRTDERGLVRECASKVLSSFRYPRDNDEALRWAEIYGERYSNTSKLLERFLTDAKIKERLGWYYVRAGDVVVAAASFGIACIRKQIK